jgi:hypothetical protein
MISVSLDRTTFRDSDVLSVLSGAERFGKGEGLA